MAYPLDKQEALDRMNKSKALDVLAKHFKINRDRDLLAVEVQFYQMDLRGILEEARKYSQDLDPDFRPSWAKFCAAPMKAKGFWVYMLEALFLHKHNCPELYTGQQFQDFAKGRRVAMMFLGKVTNDHLALAAEYAQEILPNWKVVYINGEVTNGRKAEQFANSAIKRAEGEGKNVLFIAANMAQRSFSVKEITELYLAFDGGETGATIQKMSRALTAWKRDKISKIVSLSFDPNRDDTFDLLLIRTAENYQKKHGLKSLREALRTVLRTADFFHCTPEEAIKFDIDTYTEMLHKNNRFGRAVGRMFNLTDFNSEELSAIANGNADYFKRDGAAAAGKGRTRKPGDKTKKPKRELSEKERRERAARRVIVTFCEYIDVVMMGTGADTVHDALIVLDTKRELQQSIRDMFDLEYDIARVIIRRINQSWLQLLLDKYDERD